MAMRYGYFDSEITGTDSEGMPIFDRAETSELFALFFSKLVTNGVLAKPATCFQVLAGDSGLTIKVQPGFGMVNGRFAYDNAEALISLDKAPTSYSRIDRVVLRCNYLNRLCEIIVKAGTAASSPVAPELLQPKSGDYYELGLATIKISANQTVLTQSAITDTRADSSVCGYITQLIDSIDTSVFFAQFQAFYDEFVAKCTSDYNTSRADYLAQCQEIVKTLTAFESTSESDFNAWFAAMKGQLSTDAAGKIQLEIDAITEKEFLDVYGLCTKTTSIDKTDGVTTKITESDSSSSTNTITAVTTFTRSSSGETTQIQTVVTPTSGNYYYTKTVAFATTTTGKTITESYTKTAKS